MLPMRKRPKAQIKWTSLFFQILPIVHLAMPCFKTAHIFIKCNIYSIWFRKSTSFDNESLKSEQSDRVLLWGWVMLSLMLAWWVRNHWSRCWPMIRPAVSSLKDRKSIRPHYGAASMSISPADTLQWPSHMHTPPANTKWRTLKWIRAAQYDICMIAFMLKKMQRGCGVWICHFCNNS